MGVITYLCSEDNRVSSAGCPGSSEQLRKKRPVVDERDVGKEELAVALKVDDLLREQRRAAVEAAPEPSLLHLQASEPAALPALAYLLREGNRRRLGAMEDLRRVEERIS